MAWKYGLGRKVEALNRAGFEATWLPATIVGQTCRVAKPYTVRHVVAPDCWFEWDVSARDIREPKESSDGR